MRPKSPGAVVIYDVVEETLSEVASIEDFEFVSQLSTCIMSRKGQVSTVVQDKLSNQLVVTYDQGDDKIKVYR